MALPRGGETPSLGALFLTVGGGYPAEICAIALQVCFSFSAILSLSSSFSFFIRSTVS